MEKIKWCLKVKNGIEIVEPNENLSKTYIIKSENALKAAAVLENNKEWEISSTYYAMYFAVYAILIKTGIKCENHSCTIEYMQQFLKEHFSEEDVNLLRDSMQARIDLQYYTDREVKDELYTKMTNTAPKFVVRCKEILLKMNEDSIQNIRVSLENIKNDKSK